MWVVKLTDKQLEVLRAVLRAEEHLGPALRGALEALDLARWDDLPEAELPWDEVSSAADVPKSCWNRPFRPAGIVSVNWAMKTPTAAAMSVPRASCEWRCFGAVPPATTGGEIGGSALMLAMRVPFR